MEYNNIQENCEKLFQYLKSILYDPRVQKLDTDTLDEPFRKLGKGLQYLDKAIQEMKEYSAALSKGNLSADPPGRDNFLCENLKNMQANLSHLTWQAKQVAKGDYTQTVSFLGEFSEAFNEMIRQLQEREQMLKDEARREKERARMEENYNHLLKALIRRSKGDILVTSVENPKILHISCNTIPEGKNLELFEIFLEKLKRHVLTVPEEVKGTTESESHGSVVWEAEDSEHHFYRITTSRIFWEGERAYANIIFEITEEKLAQGDLEYKAYFDKLTKIGNRYYFYKKAEELLKTDQALMVCYFDLDHLKYINDTFGHKEGDVYLCAFVSVMKDLLKEGDIFARMGGDEFCMIIQSGQEKPVRDNLRWAQEKFSAGGHGMYDRNFSFGIVPVPKGHGNIDVEALLQQADGCMYRQKWQHHNSAGDYRRNMKKS